MSPFLGGGDPMSPNGVLPISAVLEVVLGSGIVKWWNRYLLFSKDFIGVLFDCFPWS